ncbi:MAG: transcriptional repressor NrdR [candidate division Zixibacteria bacterium]|nr:transcriptional repressor NrdR [candidate division Zixibacteria bacterium]
MKCPFCGEESDKVIDSRSVQEGIAVRRRRECQSCGERYTTYEYVERVSLTVIKSDERREPYDRTKLLRGIQISLAKRPVSEKHILALVEDVENELFKMNKTEVSSKVIGELVMERLRNLDEVAYVRFASVYRKFQDKTEFVDELKNLLK